MKDLRVNCGPELDFTYCPIGQGHTDYETVLRNLHEHRCPAFLSVASHYVPAGRDPKDPDACEEALRANFRTVSALVDKVHRLNSVGSGEVAYRPLSPRGMTGGGIVV